MEAKNVAISILLGVATFTVYVAVFSYINLINKILLGKPTAIGLVGIVVIVAFLYGVTVSHVLRLINIEPKH
ncbi:MAG: hypothetical protein HY929_03515 [Euryarchaeota archaeon]|nr:hypothetical protein [Euryarchaeota archaeon]